MATSKRAVVYFDEDLHRALRLKATETNQSISALVNLAVRNNLLDGAEDVATFRERSNEPTVAFEDLMQDMKRRRKM